MLLGLGVFAYQKWFAAAPVSQERQRFFPRGQAVPVRVVPVTNETIEVQIKALGTVTPLNTVTVRSRTPEMLADPLRRAVAELDPDLPVVELRTTTQAVAGAQHDLHVANKLLAAFATLGLGLSALGVYGVISGLVAQRTQEFGIRMALGAQPHHVLRIVLGSGAFLAGLGAVLGLMLAAALLPVLGAAFPGLPGLDLPSLLAAMGLLFAMTMSPLDGRAADRGPRHPVAALALRG